MGQRAGRISRLRCHCEIQQTSLLFAVALSGCVGIVTAYASHQFETVVAQQFPQYDIADLYVFDAKDADRTAFIVNVNPTTDGDAMPDVGENGIYNIHIAADLN